MLKKSYIFVGTLITAGVVVTTAYNIINATSNQKQTIETAQIQQIDYSKDIEELKERLTTAENKITGLEEKVTSLEEENQNKDDTISKLQTKISSINNTSVKNKEVKELQQKLNDSEEKTAELEENLKQTKEKIQARSKRLSEIQERLKETANIPQNYQYFEGKIKELEKKEQTEEVIKEIEKLKIQYDIAKATREEVTALNEEMRQLLFGEIEL